MPSRNAIKEYLENGCYHVYNRGIEKRDIFCDERDYKFFLYLLKLYLSPEGTVPLPEGQSLSRRNFYGKIYLWCYVLMPNHFHLLIKQENKKDMAEFMKCLSTNYSMYFNKRHNRSGTLFQGRYKAILVQEDFYLLHLSRYIHLNPAQKGTVPVEGLHSFDYSSYADFLGQRNTKWVEPEFILGVLGDDPGATMDGKTSYKSFVEEDFDLGESQDILDRMTIDSKL